MKIGEQVENILKASHAARNSDKELLILYMQKFGMALTSEQVALFRKMPSVETIRRTRQQLQEQGKYEADESVNEARYKKYTETRGSLNHKKPEEILETMGYTVLPWGQ